MIVNKYSDITFKYKLIRCPSVRQNQNGVFTNVDVRRVL